jgi:choline dehydrogenase-like flavoprotein
MTRDKDDNRYDFDVIIVGSGVAGALAAWKLSTYNDYRILILEAGDNGIGEGQRAEFHHAMDRQGNRGDMFAPYLELPSRSMVPSPEKAAAPKPAPGQPFAEKYYDYANTPDTFRAGYNRLVGGSTWAWRGNTPRFLPTDFRLKKTYGVGRDWPIDYDDLEDYYVEAEHELGVSGNHEELDGLFGAHRSRPFPMPGQALTYSDQLIKKRIDGKKVGSTTIKVTTTPQARNSEPFDGRPACEGHSNCIPLCPIGAKYDATVHLRRLQQSPNVELRSGCVVTLLSKDGEGRVTRVHYRKWNEPGMPDVIVRAPIILVAAHAIETPKLLLMSKLANSSDQVGRNLMDHIQWEVTALFDESIYPFRGPQSVTAIESFREGAFRSQRSAFRMTIGNDGWGRAGSPSKIIDGLLGKKTYGPDLLEHARHEITRMIRLSFSTEMLPLPGNRVEVSPKLDDALKLPRPLITFGVDDYSKGGLTAGFEASKAIFQLMNATLAEANAPVQPDGTLNWNTAAHIMGTCIMGEDANDSVVDGWGRCHDHENLFIAGSSVFATGATANPTLTLAAITLRTAKRIHRQLRHGFHD